MARIVASMVMIPACMTFVRVSTATLHHCSERLIPCDCISCTLSDILFHGSPQIPSLQFVMNTARMQASRPVASARRIRPQIARAVPILPKRTFTADNVRCAWRWGTFSILGALLDLLFAATCAKEEKFTSHWNAGVCGTAIFGEEAAYFACAAASSEGVCKRC
jgi:hypothetical protein